MAKSSLLLLLLFGQLENVTTTTTVDSSCFLYLTLVYCATKALIIIVAASLQNFFNIWHQKQNGIMLPDDENHFYCPACFLKVPWEAQYCARPFTYLVPSQKGDPCQCKLHVRHPQCLKI